MDAQEPIRLGPQAILFADDDLVAVDKAPGVLCDASIDPKRDHLGMALEHWARDTLPNPTGLANPQDGPEFRAAHRLDRGTSGVVVFARNRAAATGLMKQFQDRTVSKQYQAVVVLSADAAWTVGDSIDRRSYLRHRKGATEEVHSGGKPAQSHFEVLDIDGPLALVRASPKTGRTHQLRVHLAALEAPILGDELYGHPVDSLEAGVQARLWLHADTLEIVHPVLNERLVLRSCHTLGLQDGAPHESCSSD
jgi:23S rRNA pseudouridine1911/1915/1917 synthase